VSAETISELLLALERQVYDPAVRRSPELSAPLFAEDFVEFGGNGQVFDKAGIVKVLAEGPPFAGKFVIAGFEVKSLAENVALATYRLEILTAEGMLQRQSLRSTLYRRNEGEWKQVFHQATPLGI